MNKRILSVALVLVLMLSMATTSFAANPQTIKPLKYVEITNILTEKAISVPSAFGYFIDADENSPEHKAEQEFRKSLESKLSTKEIPDFARPMYKSDAVVYTAQSPVVISIAEAKYAADDAYGIVGYQFYSEKGNNPSVAINKYAKEYHRLAEDSDEIDGTSVGEAFKGKVTLDKPGVYYMMLRNTLHFEEDYDLVAYIIIEDTKTPTPAPTPTQPKPNATPTTSTVLVNNQPTSFEAYTIDGNNYFKLRDLAQVVNGTEKNFEVEWDGVKNAINLKSNAPYTPAGGELAKGDNTPKNATQSTSVIYKDGEVINLKAYTIGGNNFFKLRDIAEAFDIGVTWDNATKTVGIDTSIGYVAD